jgi:hypothetical protein
MKSTPPNPHTMATQRRTATRSPWMGTDNAVMSSGAAKNKE